MSESVMLVDHGADARRGASLDMPDATQIKTGKGVKRSTSVTHRRISALQNLVVSNSLRNSMLQNTASTNPAQAPKLRVITRVDTPPPINTSIAALDALFEQRQKHQSDSVESAKRVSMISSSTHSSASATPTVKLQLDESELTSLSALEKDMHEYGDSDSTECPSSPNTILAEAPARKPGKQPHAPLVDELLDALFPYPLADTPLRHEYFNVATVDGYPAIPERYACPTSMCRDEFLYFDGLRAHWSEHPWNRRGILLPVTAGGIRRMSFWQHKAKYLKSLIQGPHVAVLPDSAASASPAAEAERPRTAPHRRWLWNVVSNGTRQSHLTGVSTTTGAVSTSDSGDISLFGPRSYFVSPRVLPMEQTCCFLGC
ncbi:hypothetical protein GQ54DRAFT_340102 [Martensiomyces pterosporus]|nr:hypothetical protein GQ54DRAFT_340102 [Martensiomyces pterosporus]